MAMNDYDISLVTSAKSGDTRAFEELYDRYYGKIFALARMTVKNEADAEDILQQAFLSAWRNMRSLTNPEAFSTWLQKITLNQCYSLLRRKNIKILMDAESETEDFSEDESDEFLPAVYAERDDLRSRLGKIIDSLSEVQKQTVVLHYFNEQKVEEIAYIMECNVGTVKSRLFLARKAIRAEVEEEERKSGEKFYGIAGIPMLSLGSLLNGHFEAQLLTTDVLAKTLAAISEAISQGIAEGAATIGGSVAEGAAIGGSVAAESSIAAGSTVGGSGVAAGGTATAVSTTTATTATTAATATTATGMSAGVKGAIISAIVVFGIGCGLGSVFLVDNIISSNDELPDVDDPPSIRESVNTPTPTPTQTPEPTPTPLPELIPFPEFSPQYSISVNNSSIMALKADGTVVSTDSDLDLSDWTDIVALFSSGSGRPHFGLRADGTVVSTSTRRSYEHWEDIRYISGDFALRSDGTVVSDMDPTTQRSTHQDALSALSDVERIFSVGSDSLIAIKFDGTLVAVGQSRGARQAASEWTDIIDVRSEFRALYGLKSDGTMVAIIYDDLSTGYIPQLEEVREWTDIIAFSVWSDIVMGLKSNGTVVAAGLTEGGLGPDVSQWPSHWTDIIAVEPSTHFLSGLKADGTIMITRTYVQDGTVGNDIIAIWNTSGTFDRNTIGLRSDGTVFATGSLNEIVGGWTGIKVTDG